MNPEELKPFDPKEFARQYETVFSELKEWSRTVGNEGLTKHPFHTRPDSKFITTQVKLYPEKARFIFRFLHAFWEQRKKEIC